MFRAPKHRLILAMRNAGVDVREIPEEVIEQAVSSPDIEIKILCFNQHAEYREEMKKKGHEELGDEFVPTLNWLAMKNDKAVKILTA